MSGPGPVGGSTRRDIGSVDGGSPPQGEKVEEFFAEAMAVFNGEDISAQARLLRMAPGLYAWLEQRNQNARLPIPDRALLGRVR